MNWEKDQGKTPRRGGRLGSRLFPNLLSFDPKTTDVGKANKRRYRPITKVLGKIHKFQKSTELLIPKMAFHWVVREVLPQESPGYIIQTGAVLALHESTEAYLIHLMEDTNLCTIQRICNWQEGFGRNHWGNLQCYHCKVYL